ncbi:MAG TPA: TonB-dependent receptor, partial [Maribacter sp.]|nr:TonB-dependent receptor [Maribacter sp.]
MVKHTLFLLLFFIIIGLRAQNTFSVQGVVKDNESKMVLANVSVFLEGEDTMMVTNASGKFSLSFSNNGEYILQISSGEYTIKRIPVILEDENIDLGDIFLIRDITLEKSINLITITDDEL